MSFIDQEPSSLKWRKRSFKIAAQPTGPKLFSVVRDEPIG